MKEFWSHRTWFEVLPPPPPARVTLGRALSLHGPLIPHLEQEQTLRGECVSPKHSGCKNSFNPQQSPVEWVHDCHPHFTDEQTKSCIQTQGSLAPDSTSQSPP